MRQGRARSGRVLSAGSHTLPAATRESAFVHAIASAGVAFAVTRSCAEGTSTICGCDSHHKGPPGEGWKWGGCSEDADFGVLVSREFADARENRPDARSAMNKHNNEAGRTVSCRGTTGSPARSAWAGRAPAQPHCSHCSVSCQLGLAPSRTPQPPSLPLATVWPWLGMLWPHRRADVPSSPVPSVKSWGPSFEFSLLLYFLILGLMHPALACPSGQ